jgi:hypothetical protein
MAKSDQELTAEDLMTTIVLALRDRNIPAVGALVRRLAVVDPATAERIREAVSETKRRRELGHSGG